MQSEMHPQWRSLDFAALLDKGAAEAVPGWQTTARYYRWSSLA